MKFYEKVFKERAVKLSYQRGNIKLTTDELSISSSALSKWRKEYEHHSFPGKGKIFKSE